MDMVSLFTGATLQSGKYEIIKVLGQGGFGITYLAKHKLLGSMFAIKEFFPEGYCSRDSVSGLVTVATQSNVDLVDRLRQRFLSEARNIHALNHPGVIRIHDIFEENDTAYYVMDFVEGETLEDIVARDGALPEKRAVNYARRIASALEYIHGKHMTHFDIKPANVMVRKSDNEPVLIDFGLSKQYTEQGKAKSRLLMGISQGYSPLEQYEQTGIDTFSPATDIYSLGATLYFLITGREPPECFKLLNTVIEVPVTITPKTSEAIKWAMAPQRKDRCPSASDFIEALDRKKEVTVLAKEKVSDTPVKNPKTTLGDNTTEKKPGIQQGAGQSATVSTPQEHNLDKKSDRSRWLIAVLGLVAIALIVIVIWIVRDEMSKASSGAYSETTVEEPDYQQPSETEYVEEEAVAAEEHEPAATGNKVLDFIGQYGMNSGSSSSPEYYYKGYFSDGKRNYDVMLSFRPAPGGTIVRYKNVAYDVPPFNMEVVSDTGSEITLRNNKNKFTIILSPDYDNRHLVGRALQGQNDLSVDLRPIETQTGF